MGFNRVGESGVLLAAQNLKPDGFCLFNGIPLLISETKEPNSNDDDEVKLLNMGKSCVATLQYIRAGYAFM